MKPENSLKWGELSRSVVSACPVLTVPEPSAYASDYRVSQPRDSLGLIQYDPPYVVM